MDLHNLDDKYNELIARYLNDEATAAQRTELEQWIDMSDNNATTFALAKMAWIESQENHFEEVIQENVDVNAAWSKVVNRTTSKKKTVIKFQPLFRIAAILILVVGVGFFVMNQLNPAVKVVEVNSETEQIDFDLLDGSKVDLNVGSKLTYSEDFNGKERKVILKGEAFFDIQRDTTKPFVIATNDIEIKVLGTSFNVNSTNPDSVEVHVESGVVELMYQKVKLTLREGETGLYYKKTGQLIKKDVTVIASQFWRNRKLTFKRTQLGSIVKTLNKLYDVNIAIDTSVHTERKTNVKFEDQDIELILDILSSTLNLEVEKTKDREYILHNAN